MGSWRPTRTRSRACSAVVEPLFGTKAEEHFDRRHRREACVWGTAPDALAHAVADVLPLRGASVLDAGCGEGRNAAFFASRGGVVRAIDASPAALRTAARTWGHLARIAWERADIREVELPPRSYDLVFSCSLLQWLGGEGTISTTIARVRRATRPGGVVALTTFNDRLPYEPPPGETAFPCLLPHAWFVARFADWHVLEANDTTLVSCGHGGNPTQHEHAVTTMIARRLP